MDRMKLQNYRLRLLAGGIPYALVERSLRELQDHREDLVRSASSKGMAESEANAVADSELGDPVLLANAMLSRPELKSRLHRHPVLMLLVVPLLTYLLVSALLICSTVGLAVFHEALPLPGSLRSGEFQPPLWLSVSLTLEQIIVTYLLIPALALRVTYLCIRQHVKALYRKLAVLLLCLLGSGFELIVEWYDAAGQSLNIGFMFVYASGRLDASDDSLVINGLRFTLYLVLSGLFARLCLARERQRLQLC